MTKLVLFYKIMHNITPGYLRELLPNEAERQQNHNLQNSQDIMQPCIHKNYFVKSYISSSIKLWKSDENIRILAEVETFKLLLKQIYSNIEGVRPT